MIYNNNVIDPPEYFHDSVTGRMTCNSDINFLTMKKENRKNLKSPYADNILLELDFSSCEGLGASPWQGAW